MGPSNQGCLRILEHEGRFAGSGWRIMSMRSLASADSRSGISKRACATQLRNSCGLREKNGGLPASRRYLAHMVPTHTFKSTINIMYNTKYNGQEGGGEGGTG
jgi:hypothetical protein